MVTSKRGKPVILVTPSLHQSGSYGLYHHLSTEYTDSILHAGGTPLMLPCTTSISVIDQYLDAASGVLFTANEDVISGKFGLQPHSMINEMSSKQHDMLRQLFMRAQARLVPMLAVNVGFQLVNLMLGGHVYDCLDDRGPSNLKHLDFSNVMQHRHTVGIAPQTPLEEAYGAGDITVNSRHRRGIKQLAPLLRSAALSPDGLVEAAISRSDEWVFIGVQWIPFGVTAVATDQCLISYFMTKCGATFSRQASPQVGTMMTPQELEDIRNRISALENKVAVRVTVSDLISQLSDFRQTVDMFESRLASLEAKQVDVIAEEANRICDDACASSSVDSRFLLLSQVASLSADLAIAVAAGAKEPGLDEVMDELSELQERLEHEIPTDPAITSRRTALDDDEDDLIEDTDDEVAMDQRQAG